MSSLPTTNSILLIGKGQLGRELAKVITGVSLDREQFNLTDAEQMRRVLRTLKPSVVINAAAYTDVEKAEQEKDLAFQVNAQAPEIIADECRKLGSLFIHYSTDYVFDGKKKSPYTEQDATHPLNIYGASKLAGEEALLNSNAEVLILRTSWLYGADGNNFLHKLLKLAARGDPIKVVDDQIGTPTTTHAVAIATAQLLENPPRGLYHLSCLGQTSRYALAQRIFSIVQPSVVIQPVSTADFPTKALRPSYSALDSSKIARDCHIEMPTWEKALIRELQVLGLARQVSL